MFYFLLLLSQPYLVVSGSRATAGKSLRQGMLAAYKYLMPRSDQLIKLIRRDVKAKVCDIQ
jgi:hypothetical protein